MGIGGGIVELSFVTDIAGYGLHIALQSSLLDLGRFFSFLYTVGLPGRGISP
jgi:hypothetical protein